MDNSLTTEGVRRRRTEISKKLKREMKKVESENGKRLTITIVKVLYH